MGEPAAAEAAAAEAAAAGAATSERDVLLATKLNVPGLRPDLVPRPRLARRLDEGRGRGLVLACAPAGYGKTVLLAEWVRRVRRPVAWLSLDAGDNDPARFWRHAVAALDRVRPGIGERMGPLLGPPPPPSFEPLVTALINEVAGQPDADELLLVLDDYHVISSRQVHESLGFLLEHRPPGLHLALTSRSDPPLAPARLRARGQLAELRAADLRFTPGEAAALLQQVAAAPGGAPPGAPLLQVPEAVAAALAARTEGWAAGLQLAGLSLRGRSDRAGSLIEIGALRALALAASGDADRAVDALAGALTLACPQGYVRVFADEGPPMAALLARLIAAQRSGSGFGAVGEVPLGCLARLQRALAAPGVAPDAGRANVTAAPGLIDPLTSRELEVLEMLAAGSSNQVIASQLVVTLDTVKKHVSHVLGKLGAANRTEAVARARELSLIRR